MNEHQTRSRTAHDEPPHGRAPRQPAGAESPRNLLALHDPSRQRTARRQPTNGRINGVTVEWLRPNELAARVTSKASARAVAAHSVAHHQARARLRAGLTATRNRISGRGQLAPASAFGRHASTEPTAASRTAIRR